MTTMSAPQEATAELAVEELYQATRSMPDTSIPWHHVFPCGCQAIEVEWERSEPQADDREWHPKVVATGGKRYRLCPVHPDLQAVVSAQHEASQQGRREKPPDVPAAPDESESSAGSRWDDGTHWDDGSKWPDEVRADRGESL